MKKINLFLITIALILLASPVYADDYPNFHGRAHIQDVGWVNVDGDANHHVIIGQVGSGRRLEAFTLTVPFPDLGIKYEAHVQDIGWRGTCS